MTRRLPRYGAQAVAARAPLPYGGRDRARRTLNAQEMAAAARALADRVTDPAYRHITHRTLPPAQRKDPALFARAPTRTCHVCRGRFRAADPAAKVCPACRAEGP